MDTDNSFSMCLPCQMNDIISLVRRVAPYAFVPIQQHVGYLISYEDNLTKLTGLVTRLQASREDIDHRVVDARNNGKRIKLGVQNWLDDVDEVIERANDLLEEDRRRREVGSSGWSFPNLILRHRLGKNATEIANDVAGVQGRRSDFNEVGFRPPLNEIGSSSSATRGGEKLETRETFKEDILKALRDPKASNIGIYGLGGVGKTFLVKEIAHIAEQQKLFDVVVIPLVVSNPPDIEKIQWVIADMLSLKFEEKSTDVRAMRLKERIKAEKSVLIILDDIWQPLELEKVGIPSNKEHIGCKLLMTSRTKDVLQKMDVQKDFTFRLELLSETETWRLFQSKAGDVVNDSSLNDLAHQVANQCKGLPLLIVTVASELKGKDIPTWEDEFSLLQSVGHAEMEDIAGSVLELKYKRLANDEIKALFLLSAVLGDCNEDYLLKVTMGLHIFKNINDTVAAARNRLHSIIGLLKESCLLLEGDKRSRYIQMHDLVRDVGISIACRDKHVYMSKPKAGLKNCLPKEFPKMCSQIILSKCLLHELPEKIDCPNVKLFILESVNRSLEIPDTIFDGMGSLKVLDLTRLNLSSLPTSFHSLTGLQTLCLEHCVLENIDIIGDLKNLEILSLLNSSMINLPSNIREMTKLRMLDLSNSGIEVIPPNIISSLSNLEELYMGNISIKWEDENSVEQKENDILAELQHLYNLTTLELQIHKARPLPYLNSMFEKLQRYKIAIGDVWEWSDIKDTTLKTLMLKLDTSIHSEMGIKALIKGVENLYMDEVYGIQNVLYEMNGEGFPLLRHLHIQNNAKMKHIVDSMERNQAHASFPKLETLLINNLEKLMQICHGPLAINSFGKLSVIKVKNCAKLTYLLSLSMVKRLSNLSEIEVCQCNSMKNIVLGDLPDEKVEFRSLRSLTLQNLDKLDNFFSYELMTSSITSTRPFFSAQEIVSKKTDSTGASPTFVFNQLHTILLWGLHSLKGIYAGNHILACPSLRKLDVADCAKLNLFKTAAPPASSLQICEDENLSDFLFQPLFIVEEVIPNLEWMRIEDRDAMMIMQAQNLDSLFNKLTILGLSNYKNDEATFPYWFLQNALSLECLVVEWSSFKKIFDDEKMVSMKIHTRLKTLRLTQLPKLQHICEEGSQIHPVLEVLEHLVIRFCPSLTNLLLPSSVTFSHLTYLEITNCNKLVSLITSLTAQSLVKLTILKVEDCDSLQEIIMGKEDVDIAFVSLQILILKGLPSLNNFFSSKCCLKFPLLEQVVVSKCPRMEIFSEGNTSTPSLQKVRIEETSAEWTWNGNLNDTIKKMFEVKSLS